MAKQPTPHKLELSKVLASIDAGYRDFYQGLTEQEKKSYTPIVLMRYISSLPDNHKYRYHAVLMTNDLVNLGFWNLSKYPDLQHLLLCCCAPGTPKNYRPWISVNKKSNSHTPLTDELLMTLYPWMNADELNLSKTNLDRQSVVELALDAGYTLPKAQSIGKEFND